MRRMTAVLVVAGVLGTGGGSARAQRARRAGGRAERPSIAFSDAAVAEAIRKGVDYLKSKQKADGSWEAYGKQGGGHYYPVGPTAMVVYALLESGLARHDEPYMKKALDWMAKWQVPAQLLRPQPAGGNAAAQKQRWQRYCYMTYSVGLRANAWLAAAKQGARQYRAYLRQDAKQLILSTRDGSYNYNSYGRGQSSGDNSNSQYGVLGVWAAAQLDEEVPRQYWYMVLKHWLECITGDGGWGYRPGMDTTATMTTAGLATMFVCYDNLLADGFVKCDQGPKVQAVLRPLTRALDWMDRYFAGTLRGQRLGYGDLYYLLYGVERVGLASGYKYFGKADWYKLGAVRLLNLQAGNGSWRGGRGETVSTAFALLFLVRGRHAVLFNKLEFEGDWNNRPRDMAALTRWTSRQFETTVNWQIINLRVPPEEWHDAPILYISGSKAPTFTDDHIKALRTYVDQGGTILSCTECGGNGFSKGIREVYARIFPRYKLVEVPKNHALYGINFKLEGYPGYQMVHNGVRPVAVHTDTDLAKSWQLRLTQTDKQAFQAPVNVAMYVTGKALAERALVARGAHTWPAEPTFQPTHTVKVARLQYKNNEGAEGNFDPEPLAWQRFSRMMGRDHKVKVEVAGPMPIEQLAASEAKLAVLSGTDPVALADAEKKALVEFVSSGGLLLLEAAGGASAKGGARPFAETAEALAREIAAALPDELVPRKRLRRLTISSPLLQQPGSEVKDVHYRRFTRVDVGIKDHTPRLRAVLDKDGKPLVLYSAEDLTAGLVGYAVHEVHGYTPKSAFNLVRSIVMSRAKPVAKPKPKPAKTATKAKSKTGSGSAAKAKPKPRR